MKEAHILKVSNGFLVKLIDHAGRTEEIKVFVNSEEVFTVVTEFINTRGGGPRLAIPTPVLNT